MAIKYPVKDLSAEQLYKINEEGNNGWFPIGRDHFWHGGINLNFGDDDTGSKPIRAIANGKIIAYRFTKELCALSETFDEGEETGQKYYSKDYSHNFVLIKHKHEPANSPAIEYYSLYMHLAPFSVYDTKYDKNQVSIFKRWKCEINKPTSYRGDNLRNANESVKFYFPKGATVTVLDPPKDADNNPIPFKYGNPLVDLKSNRRKVSYNLLGMDAGSGEGFIW